MRRSQFAGLAVALLLLASLVPVSAAETVWSGLVLATNAPKPEPTQAELRTIENTLKTLFGYNQFRIIGQARTTLRKGDENWLASSKYFALHVDSHGEISSRYELNLQLYQEKKLLLETEAKLGKSSPLVIRGPQVGDGQLLIVLVVE